MSTYATESVSLDSLDYFTPRDELYLPGVLVSGRMLDALEAAKDETERTHGHGAPLRPPPDALAPHLLSSRMTWDETTQTQEEKVASLHAYARHCYDTYGYTGAPKLYVRSDQADALRAVSGYDVVGLDTTSPLPTPTQPASDLGGRSASA